MTEIASSWLLDFTLRCGRGMIGVRHGDGIGVGNSLIGDKHLLMFPGISSNIVGGFKRF